MSYLTPHNGNATTKGTVLRFDASIYTVTNIVVANTNPAAAESKIDVSHLGQTTGEQAARIDRPLVVPDENGNSGRQITFDYIASTSTASSVFLLDGATGTVLITVGGTAIIGSSNATKATNYFATVSSNTVTFAGNDAVRGQAVLSLVRTTALSE